MAGEIYRLKHPLRVVHSGALGARSLHDINAVTIREATGKDMLLIDRYRGRDVGLSLAMIAALSNLTAAQVRKLHIADLEALQRLIMPSVRCGLSLRIDV